jgi:hypothetical protein
MATTLSPLNDHDILNKLKDKNFIEKALEQLDSVLQMMKKLGRFPFREYDELLDKVENFKKAVLDSMIHLEVLKDNFSKKKYQKENDLVKARFIKGTLDKIDQAALKDYLTKCLDLITLVNNLREGYGGKLFFIQYSILYLIGATLFGAMAGLPLSFSISFGTGTGAVIGSISGLVYIGCKLTTHWKQWKDDIENVRESLLEIKTALEEICKQLETANNHLGKAQIEGDRQEKQLCLSDNATRITYQNISDLEEYVCTTYDAFVDLRKILFNSYTKKES